MKTLASMLFLLLSLNTGAVLATQQANDAKRQTDASCPQRQYIFSWSLTDKCLPQPRGGTSKGAPVTLADKPSAQWQALQETGLSEFERDRRAILAMAGGYRASFEFVETIGFSPGYELATPYQSWGTEYIYVVEDQGDFISLQHIMVMYFQQDEGGVSEPMVMKHWRQDWQYQDREILEYTGNNIWQTQRFGKKEVKGTWSQSVYQVDDSPRYAAIGQWQHNASFSVWESGDTSRPLPRREFSVRQDYQVISGINRHIILPTGWVQEEENLKVQFELNDAREPNYIAKELGNNRYQRLADFDWRAGDQYWESTGPFWKIVREQWRNLANQHRRIKLLKKPDEVPMFMALFQLAEQYSANKLDNPYQKIAKVLAEHTEFPKE